MYFYLLISSEAWDHGLSGSKYSQIGNLGSCVLSFLSHWQVVFQAPAGLHQYTGNGRNYDVYGCIEQLFLDENTRLETPST
jgi:hypothetical protein